MQLKILTYVSMCILMYLSILKYATENIIDRLPANKNNFSFGCVTWHATNVCTISMEKKLGF